MKTIENSNMELFQTCRKSGMGAAAALDRARYIRKTKAEYQEWDVDQSPSGNSMIFSRIDLDDDGQEIGTWSMEVSRDEDRTVDDEECYSKEDIDAFYDDQWAYFQVDVLYTDKHGRTGSDSLGGIDAGAYWERPEYPLDEDQQVFAVAIDYYELQNQAKTEALAQPLPLKAHVESVIDRIPNVVPGRDVFYNQDGNEALISVQRAGDSTMFVSISEDGAVTSSDRYVKWERGFPQF